MKTWILWEMSTECTQNIKHKFPVVFFMKYTVYSHLGTCHIFCCNLYTYLLSVCVTKQ
jgi:hypothetical protein